jgi:hypothetical protein
MTVKSGRWFAIAAIWLAIGGMVSTAALAHTDASALIVLALLALIVGALATAFCALVQESVTKTTKVRDVPASVIGQRRGDE